MFILIPAPGVGVIYYVTPTEQPISDCPGEPCKTLDYYFCNGGRYFSSDKVNVTMMLTRGKHIYTGYNETYTSIDVLETFEMIGMVAAEVTVIHLYAGIELQNVTTSYFGNLTFINNVEDPKKESPILDLPDGEMLSNVNKTFVTVVNGTIFNRLLLYQATETPLNFSIEVINSTFINQSGIAGLSQVDPDKQYIRKLDVTKCIFNNASFYVGYVSVNVTLSDSTFNFGEEGIAMTLEYGNVHITGNILFSNIGYTEGESSQFLFFSSNVLISGNITYANNAQSITARSSVITLSGNISFINNTGSNGGALTLYSSTLNIAHNTSVYFFNNTASDTGGAIYVRSNDEKNTCMDSTDGLYIPCFYQLLDYDAKSSNWYDIQFVNNSARHGGDNIYGEFMHSCDCIAAVKYIDEPILTPSYCVQENVFSFHPETISSISSEPIRVCLCDNDGRPLCENLQHTVKVHPGELFTLRAVIVGADLGTTIGTVYSVLEAQTSALQPTSQVISSNSICTVLNYTMFSNSKYEVVYLTIEPQSLLSVKFLTQMAYECDGFCPYCNSGKPISSEVLKTPQLMNITLLPCPLVC